MVFGFVGRKACEAVSTLPFWRGSMLCVSVVTALAFFPFSVDAQSDPAPDHKPGVVSLDYCADQYVLALAAADQIVAVSPDATAEYSYLANKAHGLPQVAPTAETVLLAAPDLIVRQWGGGHGAGPILERFGMPVAQIMSGETVDSTVANLRAIGDAMGQRDRADALIADMQSRLAQVQDVSAGQDDAPLRRALYITPGGATTGTGTFVDAIITAAGLHNMGADGGREGWYPIDLEQMILDPPDIIIAGFFDLHRAQTDHWSIARHSLLREMMQDRPTIMVPSRLLACSAWFFVDAVELIHDGLNRGPDAVTLLGCQ